jgi:hypothetical protein
LRSVSLSITMGVRVGFWPDGRLERCGEVVQPRAVDGVKCGGDCVADDYRRIGFGEARGEILPALGGG